VSNNLEVLKTGYENFAKGNIPAVLETFDPKIEWKEPKGSFYGGTYTGPNDVAKNVFEKVNEDWADFTLQPNKYIESGDEIVVLGKCKGTHKATGKPFETSFAHVWTVHDGIAQSFEDFMDTAMAHEAAKS